VDDASPDGCPQLLDERARKDSRLRVLHLPVNVGLGQARNAGLEAARGEYVWFVDSDDWLAGGAIGEVLEKLAASRPDVLVIDHVEIHPEGAVIAQPQVADVVGALPLPIRLAQRPQLLRIAQSACTKIARRSLLQPADLRFAPGWYEDSYFSHVLLMAAETIDILPRPVYCYRQQTGGITSTQSARHFEAFEQYDRLFAAVDKAANLDGFRPELFRLMINHFLVIVGNRGRLPVKDRRAFFRRIARVYAERRPVAGYPHPRGVDRIKHWLVAHNSYAGYAILRGLYLASRRLFEVSRGLRGRRPRSAEALPQMRSVGRIVTPRETLKSETPAVRQEAGSRRSVIADAPADRDSSNQ
jgi:CDP-glycerol glycerophosphotransferase